MTHNYLNVLVSLRKSNLIDGVFFQYLNVNFLLATNSQLNFLSCEQLSYNVHRSNGGKSWVKEKNVISMVLVYRGYCKSYITQNDCSIHRPPHPKKNCLINFGHLILTIQFCHFFNVYSMHDFSQFKFSLLHCKKKKFYIIVIVIN